MKINGIDRFVFLFAGFALTFGLSACSNPAVPELQDGLSFDSGSQGIVGGEAVLEDDAVAAHTVGIFNLRYGSIICTGTLVSRNLVLTAGHCSSRNPGDLAIAFTNKIPTSFDEVRQLKLLKVIAGETHPEWARNTFMTTKNWGDMSLLRFDGDLPDGYKPARLLSNLDRLQKDGDVTMAGFGWTNGPKKTEATRLNKALVKIEDPKFSEMEILFNQTNGKGACHGDSGGPAYITLNGNLVLVGVTSRGHDDPRDTCEQFAVFTSVATQIAWLKTAAVELQKPEAVGRLIAEPF